MMARIGVAFSGGGFRATLYHLGVVRFLRDAGILPRVTHITSVSGGSILAAHLVLNWDRYTGSPEAFDEAVSELLRFVRLDVRNRIVRRYPLVVLRHILRWMTRLPFDRHLSRSGLLEQHYEKYLLGDTCLYELPDWPQLHILTTNLSEGCICSFTKSGLIMQRRLPGDRVAFERIQAGLTPVSLAVAASSAFPGFFPPIKIRAADIGASDMAYSTQAFTDGGVFDNLGVRAFRFIERCWGEGCLASPRGSREIHVEALTDADGGSPQARNGASRAGIAQASGPGAEAEAPRRSASNFGRDPELPAPPATAAGLDLVIVSDAGAKFSVRRTTASRTLIGTALRASDILMDRVWQLEKEMIGDAPGFLFVPIAYLVEREADPHAPLPEVQRQAVGIRTDLDRFTPAEIRALVQHGYCVARQACQTRPDLAAQLPDEAPWDPLPADALPAAPPPGRPSRPAAAETVLARTLQQSAARRIWSTLFDLRDPMTYVFVPLVAALLAGFAFFVCRHFTREQAYGRALEVIGQSSPPARKLIRLIEDGPVTALAGLPFQDVDRLAPPDYRGFEFLTDSHILDLRRWSEAPSLWQRARGIAAFQYRCMLVRRVEARGADTTLRFQFASPTDDFALSCPNDRLSPVLRRLRVAGAGEDPPTFRFELALDFGQVPVGEAVEVTVDNLFRHTLQGHKDGGLVLTHINFGKTKLATMLILLPGHGQDDKLWFRLFAHETGNPDAGHLVEPTRQFTALGGAVHGCQVMDPEPSTTYECYWVRR